MSSTNILQPSCSPKKLTLLPTTGPRSRSAGEGFAVRDVRNFRRAFVAKTGSSPADGPGDGSLSVRRGARRSRRLIKGKRQKEKVKSSLSPFYLLPSDFIKFRYAPTRCTGGIPCGCGAAAGAAGLASGLT